MCGRFYIEEDNIEFKKILNEINRRYKNKIVTFKTGEIFPTDIVPVITGDSRKGRMVDLFKWGFPNYYKPGRVIINARSETIEVKPTFKKVLFSNRCLIPASGFYEWQKNGDKKHKYFIRSSGHGLLYMAGLYNTFTGNNGKPFAGFVIITTEANKQMMTVHNRMPVLLEDEEASLWLRNDFSALTDVKKLLAPYRNLLSISSQSDK